MKDKFNKLVATGLLGLMLANFTACDDNGLLNPQNSDNTNNSIINSMIDNNLQSSKDDENTAFAKGSIWEALKQRNAFSMDESPYSASKLIGQAIPITFLTQEGVVKRNTWNELVLAIEHERPAYQPIKCYAFKEKDAESTNVYLLVNFQNGNIDPNTSSSDVYLATWQLKYTLDEDDYRTFLKLEGDWRMSLFIQEMDKQYQPEVISKAIASYPLLSLACHTYDDHFRPEGFPDIFISNIDYENLTLTYGGLSGIVVKYIDLDMRKTKAWDSVMSRDDITDEQKSRAIRMLTEMTPLGPCLRSFTVDFTPASITMEEAKQAFETTDKVSQLSYVNISSREAKYKYEEMVK